MTPHTLVVIAPKEGDAAISCEIPLDRGKSVKGRLLDPDGQPLGGARIWNVEDFYINKIHEPLPTDEFLVAGIGPGESRTFFAVHEGRKLTGSYTLSPDESGPIALKLGAAPTVSGRVLDADRRPIVGARVMYEVTVGRPGMPLFAPLPSQVTDEAGRFRSETILPGHALLFRVIHQQSLHLLAQDIVLKPGEARDLGDLTIGDDR